MDSWSTIHLPLLHPPSRYVRGAGLGLQLAHYRYRSFAERFQRSYIVDGDKSKRIVLDVWMNEWQRAVFTSSLTKPWPHVLTSASDVRRALLARFEHLPDAVRSQLPAQVRSQLSASHRFAQRLTVVLSGVGRSGTTLLGRLAFSSLPSFTYLYEPCRQLPYDPRPDRRGSIRGAVDFFEPGALSGRACAAFVAKALGCRLSPTEFARMLDDGPAVEFSPFLRELTRRTTNEAAHGANYLAWVHRCIDSSVAAKVVRLRSAASDLRPFASWLPRLRIVQLVRDPAAVVASWLKLPTFSHGGSEWNPEGEDAADVAETVCTLMLEMASTNASDAQQQRETLTLRYENLTSRPYRALVALYTHVGLPVRPGEMLSNVHERMGGCGAGGRRSRRVDGDAVARDASFDGCTRGGSGATSGALPSAVIERLAASAACNRVSAKYQYPSIRPSDAAPAQAATDAGQRRPPARGHQGRFAMTILGGRARWRDAVAEASGNGRVVGRLHGCALPPSRDTGGEETNELAIWASSRGGDALPARSSFRSPRAVNRTDDHAPLFTTVRGLRLIDRCWTPRMVCRVTLAAAPSKPLHVPRGLRKPVTLHAGGYHVVLGSDAAVGVDSLDGFATIVEHVLDAPVVNLGRVGASPGTYLGISTWPLIAPLLAQARTVIIVVMPGHSASSSLAEQTRPELVSAERVQGYLARAMGEYVDLHARIRAAAAAVGWAPPRALLLWMSPRPMLEHEAGPPALTARSFPAWISAGFLVSLREAVNATLVDASYGELSSPLELSTTRGCIGCPLAAQARPCTVDEARAEVCGYAIHNVGERNWAFLSHSIGVESCVHRRAAAARSDGTGILPQLCPRLCATVRGGANPPTAAHHLAADRLIKVLRGV